MTPRRRHIVAAWLALAAAAAAPAWLHWLIGSAGAAFAPAPHHVLGPAVCGRHRSIPGTGMLCVTVDWTPNPGNYPITFHQRNGWRAGMVVVLGTFNAAGCTIAVDGLPGIMPALLIEAAAITGTCTAAGLPAGTALVQAGNQIRLELAP